MKTRAGLGLTCLVILFALSGKIFSYESSRIEKSGYVTIDTILNYGTLKAFAATSSDGSNQALYNVPDGKVLYITAATLCWKKGNNAASSGPIYLDAIGMGHILFTGGPTGDAYDSDSISTSFPMPLKISAGHVI